jgi:hypothetical protein
MKANLGWRHSERCCLALGLYVYMYLCVFFLCVIQRRAVHGNGWPAPSAVG